MDLILDPIFGRFDLIGLILLFFACLNVLMYRRGPIAFIRSTVSKLTPRWAELYSLVHLSYIVTDLLSFLFWTYVIYYRIAQIHFDHFLISCCLFQIAVGTFHVHRGNFYWLSFGLGVTSFVFLVLGVCESIVGINSYEIEPLDRFVFIFWSTANLTVSIAYNAIFTCCFIRL